MPRARRRRLPLLLMLTALVTALAVSFPAGIASGAAAPSPSHPVGPGHLLNVPTAISELPAPPALANNRVRAPC